jgi:hypothetical protein
MSKSIKGAWATAMGEEVPEQESVWFGKLKHVEVGQRGVCVYCGDPSDTIDHLIPLCASRVGRKNGAKMRTGYGPIANACRDCNSNLGTRWFDSLWERMEWAHTRLEKQAKGILWSEAEVKKLDFTLRTHVDHSRRMGLWLRQRADWFGCREFFLNLEPLIWLVEKIPDYEPMFGSTVDKTKWELYLRRLEGS